MIPAARYVLLWQFSAVAACAAALLLAVPETSAAEEVDAAEANPDSAMMLIEPNGSNLQHFYSRKDVYVGSPQWSPNGKLVAFDSWRRGETFVDTHVEILDVSTGTTRDLGPGAMPSWSPDQKQLVCHTYRGGDRDIVVMDIDGKGREVLLDHWGSPRWAPDGRRIISANAGGISVFDLETGMEHIVAAGARPWQGISISPDGNQVCFGDIGRGVHLAMLNADRTAATVTTIARDGQSYHSSWSPDGKQIVFNWCTTADVCPHLYLCKAESKLRPTLMPGQDLARENCDPSWSPDGSTILFVSKLPPPEPSRP